MDDIESRRDYVRTTHPLAICVEFGWNHFAIYDDATRSTRLGMGSTELGAWDDAAYAEDEDA